jgi:hypothetical protein
MYRYVVPRRGSIGWPGGRGSARYRTLQFSGELQNFLNITVDVTFAPDMPWYPTTLAGASDDNLARMEGVDYHNTDQLVVNTGPVVDLVNVRGSSGMSVLDRPGNALQSLQLNCEYRQQQQHRQHSTPPTAMICSLCPVMPL